MFSDGMFTICIFFKYTAFCYQLCVNYVSIVTILFHLSNFQATVHQPQSIEHRASVVVILW